MFSDSIKENGYSLSLEKEKVNRDFSDFKIAIPIKILFVIFCNIKSMSIIG